ncbi:Uncharacterised protein [Mycobacteroides abscessus subsp. massiliense]|uniref:hypothetical protein n=1 Tax=Mycobacteroides abscessus TaxID=36809 RepID=UPI0005E14DCD|nr:hypothetical protein [Mycobacteroides abscessus]CPS09852.1 Uncharacterised protein [Mycobacteroides abscessus]CPU99096.1 Uncharacterised protein [Mycobacteroides abscessus]SKY03082.1 Uncharacterised protein [Mycobacteroides abscessus subsp. massiliense]SKZ08059.1 Uncharacterised protein [Mycobacteroides abscessus subsp. massiliense]SLH91688.1 Uncharacterised protein [Mycobacteroides abscessus subsp. massiliense]
MSATGEFEHLGQLEAIETDMGVTVRVTENIFIQVLTHKSGEPHAFLVSGEQLHVMTEEFIAHWDKLTTAKLEEQFQN